MASEAGGVHCNGRALLLEVVVVIAIEGAQSIGGLLLLWLLLASANLSQELRVLEGTRTGTVRHHPVAVVRDATCYIGVGQEWLGRPVNDLVEILKLRCVLAGDGLVDKGARKCQLIEHRLVSTSVRPVAPLLRDATDIERLMFNWDVSYVAATAAGSTNKDYVHLVS